MRDTKKVIDPLPDEFSSYEEATEFWESHDTTDYLEVFETIDVEISIQGRTYEVAIDEDIAQAIQKQAKKLGVTPSRLTNDLLRKQIASEER
jgi:cell division protein ZapA (FtsZ GTPase activity inhibitor)